MKYTFICVVVFTILIGCTQHTTLPQNTQQEEILDNTTETVKSPTNTIGWPTQYLYQETSVCLQGTNQRGMHPQMAFSVCTCIYDKLREKYTLGEYFTRKLHPDYSKEIVDIVTNQCSKTRKPQQQIKEYETQYWIRNENFNI